MNRINRIAEVAPERDYYSTAMRRWTDTQLTPGGRYAGEPLYEFGFPYRVGEVIPQGKRWMAMYWWLWASRIRSVVVDGLMRDCGLPTLERK